jgi:hypothetical protein
VPCRGLIAAFADGATVEEIARHVVTCPVCGAGLRPADEPDKERARAAFRAWRAGIVAPQ